MPNITLEKIWEHDYKSYLSVKWKDKSYKIEVTQGKFLYNNKEIKENTKEELIIQALKYFNTLDYSSTRETIGKDLRVREKVTKTAYRNRFKKYNFLAYAKLLNSKKIAEIENQIKAGLI